MLQKYKQWMPQVEEGCYLAPGAAVIGKVHLGKYASVWHNAVLRGDVAAIYVGEGTNIQDCSTLHCSEDMEIRIGNGVTVGHGAILHSCRIGDNTLIGMGAIVLDGANIGKNCLIGAGALITPNTEIPDGSMVLGSPGKVKRLLTEEEMEGTRRNAQEYIRLAEEYQK